MAKLRQEQLASSLNRSLAPIYLVSGDEPLLIQECCDMIRAAARKSGFSERDLYHVDTHFDWDQLLASANSLSLFAEKKIIEVRMPSGKPGDKGGKAIQEYSQSPAPDNLLLIVTEKIDGATQKAKWFKAIEDIGQHIQLWPVTVAQLPRWISIRLQQAGLNAGIDAVELLASRVEGNLLAAAQEVEKLKLMTSDGNISYELMASVVADSSRYDVFSLTDRALHGNARDAVRTLHGLKAEGTEPIAILWAVTREIRSLVQISQAVAQGKDFQWAAKQAGVWDKRQPIMQSAFRRLRPAHLQQLLRKANGIDKAVKGMRNAQAWDELLDLVLNIAGVQSLSAVNERLNLKT